ncbi:MAG: O-antigen ligase family protein [Oscillospiraceae bacterium]
MRDILEASFIYRWLTAAAKWIDRQWSKSWLAFAVSGGAEKTEGSPSVFGKIGGTFHGALCAVFKALRLDKIFAGSIFSRPYLWCVLACFIAPIAPTMVTLAVVLVCFASMFIRFGSDRKLRLSYSPVNKWIYIFAMVYLVCTFTSVTLSGSLKGGILTSAFVLFSIVLQNAVTDRRGLNNLIYMLVAAGFIVAAYGLLQVVMGVESTTDWIDEDTFSTLTLRVYSTLGNPNVLAEYLLLVIPLAAASIFTAKTPTGKVSAAVATGAMIVCMALTYARGGYLGLIFAAAIFLVLLDRRFIVVGIVALIGLVFVLPDSILSRFASIGDMSDSSTSYRVYIWMGTLAMLKDYWMCGVGTGMNAFMSVYPAYSYNTISAPHAHNLYLQITSECGVCGLFALLGVIFSFVHTTASAISRTEDRSTKIQLIAVISGMGGFLLQSMTDHSFYSYRVVLIFWVVVAIGAMLSRSWEIQGEKGL